MPRYARFRTADQSLVREINLSQIMQRLFEHTRLSRAALAELTGLNKSTVSSLVQELQDMGFVREAGINTGGVGRPSVMLELNPTAGMIVSAELGVDFISAKCADFGADIRHERHVAIQPELGQQVIMERLVTTLRSVIDRCGARSSVSDRLLGIAVGAPGLVDEVSGTLLFAPNLRWENVPLLAFLSQRFEGVPVFVDNEANLAALGEYFFGTAKGYQNILFISLGVGLGGAFVRGGQLAKGTSGLAGEFGHMTMYPDGDLCNCGNRGCWETQVSQYALFRDVRAQIDAGKASQLETLTGSNWNTLSLPLIVQAATNGDEVALTALNRVGRHLGTGIASLVNALNPDLVVFGGMFSLAGDIMLPLVKHEIARSALRWHASATEVMLARHGADACVIGGIATVCQKILMEPASFRAPA